MKICIPTEVYPAFAAAKGEPRQRREDHGHGRGCPPAKPARSRQSLVAEMRKPLRRDVTKWACSAHNVGRDNPDEYAEIIEDPRNFLRKFRGLSPGNSKEFLGGISAWLTPRNFKEISGTTVLEIAKRFLRANRGTYRYHGHARGVFHLNK